MSSGELPRCEPYTRTGESLVADSPQKQYITINAANIENVGTDSKFLTLDAETSITNAHSITAVEDVNKAIFDYNSTMANRKLPSTLEQANVHQKYLDKILQGLKDIPDDRIPVAIQRIEQEYNDYIDEYVKQYSRFISQGDNQAVATECLGVLYDLNSRILALSEAILIIIKTRKEFNVKGNELLQKLNKEINNNTKLINELQAKIDNNEIATDTQLRNAQFQKEKIKQKFMSQTTTFGFNLVALGALGYFIYRYNKQ